MNEKVVSLLRGARTVLQAAAEPVDWTARMLNNKRGYPPLRIRQKVGGLNDFEGSGAEYMAYLKLLCELKPGMSVLDIGCGCGLMCLPVSENETLSEYIKPGSYCGMDTDKELIDWCEKNIKLSNGFFVHLDGAGLLLSLKETVDVVLCKSLFTHLFAHEAENYLKEIYRLLRSNGCCLSTWFLLDEKELKGRYTFEHYEGNFSTERYTNPRLAVAYDQEWLLGLLDELKLSCDVYYGSWRGTGGSLSFQDIIVLRRGE